MKNRVFWTNTNVTLTYLAFFFFPSFASLSSLDISASCCTITLISQDGWLTWRFSSHNKPEHYKKFENCFAVDRKITGSRPGPQSAWFIALLALSCSRRRSRRRSWVSLADFIVAFMETYLTSKYTMRCFPTQEKTPADTKRSYRTTDLPAFLTNPTSASTAWQISQQKQSGCQLLFMALITRPMMNSPGKRDIHFWLIHDQRHETQVFIWQPVKWHELFGCLCTVSFNLYGLLQIDGNVFDIFCQGGKFLHLNHETLKLSAKTQDRNIGNQRWEPIHWLIHCDKL